MFFEPWFDTSRREGGTERKSRAKQPGLVGRGSYVVLEFGAGHAVPRLRLGETPDGVVQVDDCVPIAECLCGRSSERHEGGRRVVTLVEMPIPFPPHLGVDGGWLISGWKIAPARR